jgi:hypothetical protein
MHHLERRHLGADEQYRLALAQSIGDQIGNCLALAGAWGGPYTTT